MKHLLLTTISAVVLVGCGESQQSTPPVEAKPEPPTAKAPDISIHDAAIGGNIEAVKKHLAAGANVNAKDMFGETPFHKAALGGRKEIVELLIAKGADVNAKNEKGFTPMDHAAIWDHKEIVDLLVKHGGKSGAADSIHVAAAVGNIEAVKQHLAAGTDVQDEGDWTPLHHAAYNGHKEIVELLIANDADVNAKEIARQTPLHVAAYNGHKEIVELLIDAGADVNAKPTLFGWVPLHNAVRGGQKEVAELLIASDADVNAKDDDGGTPLDLAIKFKNTETADLLRKHGGKTKKELEAAGK